MTWRYLDLQYLTEHVLQISNNLLCSNLYIERLGVPYESCFKATTRNFRLCILEFTNVVTMGQIEDSATLGCSESIIS